MAVIDSDVRRCLNDISTSRISDLVIQNKIEDATAYIESLVLRSGITDAKKDRAIKYWAAYFAYQTYLSQYRNDVSSVIDSDGVPMQIDGNDTNRTFANTDKTLEELKKTANMFTNLIINNSNVRYTKAGLTHNHSYIDSINNYS